MGSTTYFTAALAFVVLIGAVGWGAYRLRRALLPVWSGIEARLAEVVMAIAVPVVLAEILGLFGWFRRVPVVVIGVAGGVAMGVIGRRLEREPAASHPPFPRSRVEELVVAAGALAVVAAQWVSHVAVSFDRGMTHFDTLWYHQPYATRFVQSGHLTDLVDRPDDFHAYIGHGSELVHGLVMLPFGRDIVSPLVGLGWAALALLAAACIGRSRGVGALSVLGAVAVLGLPMLAGTHPGQASNDVACGALLVAAIALLLAGELAPVPTALAGVAAGLALAVKLTAAAPVAVLTIGLVVVALRAGRRTTALAWCASVAVFGCYWFLRNLSVADNPLPFFDLWVFERQIDKPGLTIVDRLRDGEGIDFLFPAYTDSLGRAWPLILLLGVGGALAAIVGRRSGVERVAGCAVLAGAIAYPFTPLTGDRFQFAFTVRFIAPVLLAGAALLPLAVAGVRNPWWRRGLTAALAALVLLGALASHHEGIEAWPTDHLVAGLLAGLVALGVAALALTGQVPVVPARRALVGGVALLAVLVAGGWFVQRHYFDHRYLDAGLRLDRVYAEFRDRSDERVAVFGEAEIYPLFGTDLSNRVTTISGPGAEGSLERCRYWQDVLTRGRYRYLVVTANQLLAEQSPQPWVAGDPGVTVAVRSGDTVAYEIDGTLDPDRCRGT